MSSINKLVCKKCGYEWWSKTKEAIKDYLDSVEKIITRETLIPYVELVDAFVRFKDDSKYIKTRKKLNEWFSMLAGDEDLYSYVDSCLKEELSISTEKVRMWKTRIELLK